MSVAVQPVAADVMFAKEPWISVRQDPGEFGFGKSRIRVPSATNHHRRGAVSDTEVGGVEGSAST